MATKTTTLGMASRVIAHIFGTFFLITCLSFFVGCADQIEPLGPGLPKNLSVWVFNEGQYGASNASITAYDPQMQTTRDEIFAAANGGARLGDVPSSATLSDGKLYVPLSGSGKIYILDPQTGRLDGKITGLASPRHVLILSQTKGYISNLDKPEITIFNPTTAQIIGAIPLESPAEQMIKIGDVVYTNLWSYGNKVVGINPAQDKVISWAEVGVQPMAIAGDKNGMLWVMCDGGGWQGNPAGFEPPTLVKLDPKANEILGRWTLADATAFSMRMVIDYLGANIYYLTTDVFRMSIEDEKLPAEPFISLGKDILWPYGLGIDPAMGDIYVSDAVDFTQRGTVYRYDRGGRFIEKFRAGVTPSFFAFF